MAAAWQPKVRARQPHKVAPAKGGTLIFGEWQAAAQLNPYLTTAVADFEAMFPISRGLVTVNDDGVYVPDLAVSMPSIDNGALVVDKSGDGFTLTSSSSPGSNGPTARL